MQRIEPHISKYIDSSVDKAISKALKDFNKESKLNARTLLKEFNEDSKRHMSVLIEQIDERVAEVVRVAKSLPTEERVREIVHEEIKPLRSDIKLCISEIQEHRKELDRHEELITSLELDAA